MSSGVPCFTKYIGELGYQSLTSKNQNIPYEILGLYTRKNRSEHIHIMHVITFKEHKILLLPYIIKHARNTRSNHEDHLPQAFSPTRTRTAPA